MTIHKGRCTINSSRVIYETCISHIPAVSAILLRFFKRMAEGNPVIRAEQLTDASEIYEEPEAEKIQHTEKALKLNRSQRLERFRDIKMKLDTGEVLCLLAQENQNAVDYTMPFRCMQYDVMEYSKQLQNLRRKNAEDGHWNSWAEQSCGIRKEDRLIPIYTLCVYHGLEKWDGPRSLKDMMEFGNNENSMSKLFADYPMQLFCLNELDDFEVFHSEIKQLFQAIRYRQNKKMLKQFMTTDPAYQHMDADTLEVISVMLNAPEIWQNREKYMSVKNDREEYDMCQALKEWAEEEQNIGIEKGILQGIEQGKLLTLISLVKQGLLQLPDAAKQLDITVDEFREIMN